VLSLFGKATANTAAPPAASTGLTSWTAGLKEIVAAMEQSIPTPPYPGPGTDAATESTALLDLLRALGCDMTSPEPLGGRFQNWKLQVQQAFSQSISSIEDAFVLINRRLAWLAEHGGPGLLSVSGLPGVYLEVNGQHLVAVDMNAPTMPADHKLHQLVPRPDRFRSRFICLGLAVLSPDPFTPGPGHWLRRWRAWYTEAEAVALTTRCNREELLEQEMNRLQKQARAERDRAIYESHPMVREQRLRERLERLEQQVEQTSKPT
jgi:hypothetical protein